MTDQVNQTAHLSERSLHMTETTRETAEQGQQRMQQLSHAMSQIQTASEETSQIIETIDDIALINVEGSGLLGVPGIARRLFGTLEQNGVNVILISQASSEHSITFATSTKVVNKKGMNQAMIAQKVLQEEVI